MRVWTLEETMRVSIRLLRFNELIGSSFLRLVGVFLALLLTSISSAVGAQDRPTFRYDFSKSMPPISRHETVKDWTYMCFGYGSFGASCLITTIVPFEGENFIRIFLSGFSPGGDDLQLNVFSSKDFGKKSRASFVIDEYSLSLDFDTEEGMLSHAQKNFSSTDSETLISALRRGRDAQFELADSTTEPLGIVVSLLGTSAVLDRISATLAKPVVNLDFDYPSEFRSGYSWNEYFFNPIVTALGMTVAQDCLQYDGDIAARAAACELLKSVEDLPIGMDEAINVELASDANLIGDYQTGYKTARNLIEFKPDFAAAYQQRAIANLGLGRIDDAREDQEAFFRHFDSFVDFIETYRFRIFDIGAQLDRWYYPNDALEVCFRAYDFETRKWHSKVEISDSWKAAISINNLTPEVCASMVAPFADRRSEAMFLDDKRLCQTAATMVGPDSRTPPPDAMPYIVELIERNLTVVMCADYVVNNVIPQNSLPPDYRSRMGTPSRDDSDGSSNDASSTAVEKPVSVALAKAVLLAVASHVKSSEVEVSAKIVRSALALSTALQSNDLANISPAFETLQDEVASDPILAARMIDLQVSMSD